MIRLIFGTLVVLLMPRLGWSEWQVVPTTATYGRIAISTGGTNCAPVTIGNAGDLVRAECGRGSQQCVYTVDASSFPVVPDPGCKKSIDSGYLCLPDYNLREVGYGGVTGDANGKSLLLDCALDLRTVDVIEATYGEPVVPGPNQKTCAPVLKGNYSSAAIRSCQHWEEGYVCTIRIDLDILGGDPVPGCFKGLTVKYQCPAESGGPTGVQTATVGGTKGKDAIAIPLRINCGPTPPK